MSVYHGVPKNHQPRTSPVSEESLASLPTAKISHPRPTASSLKALPPGPASKTKLFTQEELAVLPNDALDRQKRKQQAKKAKKRRLATEKTEGELLLGFLGMDIEEPESVTQETVPVVSSRKVKKKAKRNKPPTTSMELDEEEKKEADFANFLATMEEDQKDEEL
ncbi:MAG: hypothetical protein TREMPRED_002576 [Tremellales sp. Tagirdzhanova-0007]|nr:MAG: hypothetical protein TREMPRED_002576 [Tremellales sp. Tagirdzhanova-0007]